jgi:hypothetical protein
LHVVKTSQQASMHLKHLVFCGVFHVLLPA